MDKKLKAGIIIIVFLIISQYFFIKLVYAHKLENNLGIFFSKVYNLKAGSIKEEEQELAIPLADYLKYKDSLEKYLEKNEEEIDIEEVIWERLIKNVYLNKIAQNNNIFITKEEFKDYLDNLEDLDEIKEMTKESFGISFANYKELVIKPFILESKVYSYLLDNYNDLDNITKAQNAYEALESGQDFLEVAQEYSSDLVFAENSMCL